jgi:hypothetical protein
MPPQYAISTWVREENLQLFLERLSAFIGYRFEDWDWDAVRFGICDTDSQHGQWYEYELRGSPPVELAFARADDTERLNVKVVTEEPTAVRIEALARILQCYDAKTGTQELEILLQIAFAETTYPGDSKIVACDAAHLACCPECREALAYFRGQHWRDLLQGKDTLPRSYGGLVLLTPEARRFFFPAYVAMALRNKDTELLEVALEATGRQSFAPLQQELVEFALQFSK